VRRSVLCALCMLLAACGRDATTDATRLTDADTPPDLARQVAELLPALERLSGLDRRETLRVRRQDRDAARAYVRARLDEELPPQERESLRRTYVMLGLLPDTLDLEALLLDLYTEQVLGYYDPKSETLFVVAGQDAAALRPTLAHELVHALQDQHVSLDSLISAERGNDRQVAAHAAMEGHAMIVMFAVLAEEQSGDTIDPAALPNPATELAPALERQNSQFPVFQRAPRIIREGVLFPYLSGAGFVHALWRSREPNPRYPAPIDSLLPQSTEQVMRPLERFVQQRDQPSVLAIDSIANGWSVVRDNELGQFETAIFLREHIGETGRAAADGWDGDRYVLLRDAGGRDVLHWFSVWDSEQAARTFAAAAAMATGFLEERAAAVRLIPGAAAPLVHIVIAHAGISPDTLPRPRLRLDQR
jgi:hypothetical protein